METDKKIDAAIKESDGRPPRAADRILGAARELFYGQGIRAIGVDEIVRHAGVTKPSLYRSFPSKDALAASYLEQYDRDFWTRFEASAARHPGDPRAQLLDYLDGVGRRMAKSGYHYATPTDALGDSRWAPGTTDAKSRRSSQGLQVAVATADARCQQQANVAGTRLAVLTGYQDQLISSNLGQLRTYQGEMAKLAANARAVLGGKQP